MIEHESDAVHSTTERRNRNLHLGAGWRIVPELYRPEKERTEDTARREEKHFLLLGPSAE